MEKSVRSFLPKKHTIITGTTNESVILYFFLRILKLFVFGTFLGYFSLDDWGSAEAWLGYVKQVIGFLIWAFFSTSLLYFLFSKKRNFFVVFFIFEYFFLTIYLFYYQYFRTYPSISQISHLSEGIQAISTLKIVFKPYFFLFGFIDFPAILLLHRNKNTIKDDQKQNKKRMYLLLASIFLLLVREIDAWKNKTSFYHFMTHKATNHARNFGGIVRNYGPVLASFSTILLLNEEKSILNLIRYGPEKQFFEKPFRPNIILIQVESLDSSVLFVSISNKPIVPFLFSLRKKAIFAPVMVAYHFGAGGTTDADFAILNALEPSPHKPLYNLKTYTFPQSLPHILHSHGYRCVAFHNNEGVYFDRKDTLIRMGFDEFYDMASMKLSRKWWGAPDGDMFSYIKKNIVHEKEPFFYYIITMSTHGPFEHVRRDYKYTNEDFDMWDTDSLTREYWNAISYVDGELEKFITFISSHVSNTLICIVGDHSTGISGKNYSSSTVFIENQRLEIVPLFLIIPQNFNITNKHITYALSHLDVSPTLLDLAGIQTSLKTYGDSIFATNLSPIPFLGLEIERRKIYNLFIHNFSMMVLPKD